MLVESLLIKYYLLYIINSLKKGEIIMDGLANIKEWTEFIISVVGLVVALVALHISKQANSFAKQANDLAK